MELRVDKILCAPAIQNFISYRQYIGSWFDYKKHLRKGFSHRILCSRLGLSSPNYILLVMKGERNLSNELAEKMSLLMGHGELEHDYFLWLVRLDHAMDSRERLESQKNLLRLNRKMSTSIIKECQMDVLGSWQHMLVRECVFFPDFRPTVDYIVEKLDHLLTEEEAELAINTLLKGHFWIEKENRWQANDPVLDSGDHIFKAPLINQFHSSTLKKWAEWIEKIDEQQRDLGVLFIPINSEKIPELKNRIRQFQDEIIGWLQSEVEPDQIVNLGTYLVPMKKSTK